jgi:plasmid stability protein
MEPFVMPVSLSIKNVPDEVVDRLRQRAERNKRSLQCELLVIVEDAAAESRGMTIDELYERAHARGLTSKNESARIVRRMRDKRTAHLERVLEKARGRR